jgi:hypothetical protein
MTGGHNCGQRRVRLTQMAILWFRRRDARRRQSICGKTRALVRAGLKGRATKRVASMQPQSASIDRSMFEGRVGGRPSPSPRPTLRCVVGSAWRSRRTPRMARCGRAGTRRRGLDRRMGVGRRPICSVAGGRRDQTGWKLAGVDESSPGTPRRPSWDSRAMEISADGCGPDPKVVHEVSGHRAAKGQNRPTLEIALIVKFTRNVLRAGAVT